MKINRHTTVRFAKQLPLVLLGLIFIKYLFLDLIIELLSPPNPPHLVKNETVPIEYLGSKEIGYNRELKQISYTIAINQRNISLPPLLDGDEQPLPRVMFLCLINDANSYGKGRDFSSLVQLIAGMKYPSSLSEAAFLISDPDEYDDIEEYLDENYPHMPFSKMSIMTEDAGSSSADHERENRHSSHIQASRRRKLAVLRNRLSYTMLRPDIDGVFWIDVDVIEAPKGLVKKLATSGLDIATPICLWGETEMIYDANAWIGNRQKPSADDLEKMRRGEYSGFVPAPVEDDKYHLLSDFRKPGIDYVELDSVGGTMLWIKAEVLLSGVNFPVYYTIGAEWESSEGYDGIETEGICYVAKSLGYKCWGFPNLVVRHELEDVYRKAWSGGGE